MTQEEKFEEAKRLYETANADQRYVLERLFPELRESEDERIREELIETIHLAYDCGCSLNKEQRDKYLAWLEKQGEQKSVVIIPKFRIGDEIKTSNEESLTITKIDEKGYWSEDLFICDFGDAAKWELVEQKAWTEEDKNMLKWVIGYLDNRVLNAPISEERTACKNAIAWLKSLKDRVQPQSQWKPSYEQVSVLEFIMEGIEKDSIRYAVLNSILEQLMKLREE